MAVQLARRLINVDEYYSMYQAGILKQEDRVELIHGEILEMTPIGSKHASSVIRLENKLKELFGNSALISTQNPIRINDLNETEPDLMILKPKDDFYAEKHPEAKDVFILIEVSDTTYNYDKEIKLPIYASAGVPEYWIVNIEKKVVEIYTVPEKGAYKKLELFYPEDSIPLAFCHSEIMVSDIVG